MPTFLSPLTMLGLAAAAIPPLVLLYFLKLKRTDQPISSTLLWKKAVHDLQVNAPFQRLRRNLLFFLQLLILLAIIAALGQPMVAGLARAGETFVLLIDRSASMNATDEDGESRLEKAKEEAIEQVKNLTSADRAMVIAFAGRASVVSPFSNREGELIERIRAIRPSDEQTRLAEALELAEAYASPPQTRDDTPIVSAPVANLILFSDGRVNDAEDLYIRRGTCRMVQIGQGGRNVGIVEVGARRNYERPETLSIFAVVKNLSSERFEDIDVEFRLNDMLELVQDVSLAPAGADGDTQRLTFDRPEYMESGVLEVRLDVSDDLATDNAAWAVFDAPRQLSVVLVTSGNYFLEKALGTLSLKSLEVISPEQYDADGRFDPDGSAVESGIDVIVIDRHNTNRLPEGSFLFFGSIPEIEGVETDGLVDNEVILDWDDSHRLLRYVSMDQRKLQVGRWLRLHIPDVADVIVEGETTAVVATYSNDRRQYVIVAFDTLESRWPLIMGFQIFLYNAIPYLGGGVGADDSVIVRPGEPLRVDADAAEISVIRPDGETRRLSASTSGPTFFADTDRVGVYRMSSPEPDKVLGAINLLDIDESNIAPNDELTIGSDKVEVSQEVNPENRPAWKWLAWSALAILLLEWYIYNRRTYV
jgi:hypothetical protein